LKKSIRIKTILLFSVLLLGMHCSSKDEQLLTTTVQRSSYRIQIQGEGVLEAKNSKSINTPMIWPRPTIAYLIDEGSIVKKGDLVARLESTEIQNDYVTMLDQLEIVKADAEKKIADMELQRLLYKSQMQSAMAAAEAARLNLAQLQFEAPLERERLELDIQENEIEANNSRAKVESLEKIQTEERAHSRATINQVMAKLQRAEAMLQRMELEAPQDGMVIYAENWTTDEKIKVGDAIHPRSPIISIPDLSEMRVKLYLGESESQRIREGMPTEVTVPTVGTTVYPAHVSKIDKIAKPINRGSDVKRVEVFVELDEKNPGLQPGITADAKIILRNITDVIAVPQEAIFTVDSMRVVYKKDNHHFIPLPVAILMQDRDYAIVHGDLPEGSELALQKPGNSKLANIELEPIEKPAWADTLEIKSPPPDSNKKPLMPFPGQEWPAGGNRKRP